MVQARKPRADVVDCEAEALLAERAQSVSEVCVGVDWALFGDLEDDVVDLRVSEFVGEPGGEYRARGGVDGHECVVGEAGQRDERTLKREELELGSTFNALGIVEPEIWRLNEVVVKPRERFETDSRTGL